MTKYLVVSVLVCFSLCAPGMGHAREREKVDVIYIKNGDRITGEIISLQYGQLEVKTDSLGTINIEWPDVVSVDSEQTFILEDQAGGHYYGKLTTDRGANELKITDAATTRILLGSVTRISQGEATFLDRLQGSLSVGFDYAKSSDITTSSFDFDLAYRSPKVAWGFGADFNSTKDPVRGTLDRDTITYNYRWLRPNKRFWTGLASLERNEETGIEARASMGGGVGKYVVETGHSELAALVGLMYTMEWATGTADSQDSLEGLLGASWRIFKFNTPKVSLTASAEFFPSITESGRYRGNSDVSLRREIISDLYLDLSVYYTYDSDPPDVNAAKDDYGITTSLGYSFD